MGKLDWCVVAKPSSKDLIFANDSLTVNRPIDASLSSIGALFGDPGAAGMRRNLGKDQC